MFLYFLAYITVLRKFKFIRNFIEGQQDELYETNKKQKKKKNKYRRSYTTLN